jgi:hypothetical protein
MLDMLVAAGLVTETDGKGGYPAYFLPLDEPPYRLVCNSEGTVCEWRPWEPPEKRYACIAPDGTEVVGDGSDDRLD